MDITADQEEVISPPLIALAIFVIILVLVTNNVSIGPPELSKNT